MVFYLLQREQRIPRPVEECFAFFADVRNLEEITPTWLSFRIVSPGQIDIRAGTHINYKLSWHGFSVQWLTEIQRWNPPIEFVDVQARGPYRLWHHTHSFEPVDGGTLMRDVVRYALPLGILGRIAHAWVVKSDLEKIFDYRAVKVSNILGAGCVHE